MYLAANFHLKFLCARQFQNRISESVYTLIKDKIENSLFRDEFEFTKNSIKHKTSGSEFLFYGIARNLSEIKSTEGVDILWLEEAHYLTEEQWNVIEPTIRKEGSEIWLIWNPDEISDFIYQNFVVNPPADCVVRKINWEENPYLSDTMIKVIQEAYKRDPENAKHVYGGYPKTGGDKSVINLMYIEAAMDAHIKLGWEPSGSKRTGYDVADDGEDMNATADMHGNVLMEIDEWKGLEDKLLQSASRVFNRARAFGSTVTYDSIGVGAFVGSQFAGLNEGLKKEGSDYQLSYDPFNAGGKVNKPDDVFMELPHTKITNADYFSNLKAQAWVDVATRFRKTYETVSGIREHPFDELISINTATLTVKQRHQICMELSTPRKDTDLNGKFKVESKKDMREKRKIKSPNVADAIIMAAIKPIREAAGFFDW